MAEIYIFNPFDELLTTISSETGLISAPFREELNRLPDDPFTFTVDTSFKEAAHIKEENQVVFKDKDGDLRLYVIKELDDSDGTNGTETIAICEPAFMELKERMVIDRRFINRDAQFALNAALQGTGWKGTVELELETRTTNFYYENVIDSVWKIIDVWGGEFKDVVTFSGSSIVSREIKIVARRGYDRGKRFEIEHNMEGIRRTVLSYPITAIYGRGASLAITDEEGDATGGYTRFIDFADVEWKKLNGDPVDKPKGQLWVGDPSALKKYGRLRNGSILHRETEWQNGDYEDPKEVLKATWDQLQRVKAPEINYQLNAYLFESIAGYEHEHVALGDTARAIDRNFSRPIEIQARVIAISYDLVDINGTAEIEMGQFLSVHDYDDRLDKVHQKVGNNSGAWDQAARPIDGSRYPDTIPPVPPNVKATGLFAMALVEWDFDYVRTFIQGYEVFVSEVKGFLPSPETMVYRGSTNSYSYEGETNKQYYFRVRAFNYHQRYSKYSQEVSATTAKIISDDIFFGPELAAELRELSKEANIIAENTLSGKELVDGAVIDKHIADNMINMQHLKPGIISLDKFAEDTLEEVRNAAKQYTEEEIKEVKKTLSEELAYKADLLYVEGKFKFSDEKLKELDQSVADFEATTTQLKSDFSSTLIKLDDVTTEIESIDQRTTKLRQDVDGFQFTVSQIEATIRTEGQRITKAESQLDIQATAIEQRATKTTVDELTDRVSKSEARIITQAGQINARVTKDGLMSELNIQPESLKIKSGLIHLAGNSRIDNAVIHDAHINNLSGDKIIANTIGARQLMIADFTNLVINGDFEDDVVGRLPNSWEINTNPNERVIVSDWSNWVSNNGSKHCLEIPASSVRNVDVVQDNWIAVKPGDEFYFQWDARFGNLEGRGQAGIGFRNYDALKTHVSWRKAGWTTSRHYGVTTYTATYVIPDGVYYVRPWLMFDNNGENTNKYYVDNVIIRKRYTGELIVDGTIEARHLKVGTITANSGIIAEAAIGTAAIANGAITRAKLERAIIGTAQIEDGVITRAKIGDLAVDTAKIANGAITNAKISSLDAAKINAGTVTGIRLRSVDMSSWFEVQGARIRMEMTNGRHMTIDNTGIYYMTGSGDILFQSSRKLTTSDIFGTADTNVYLASFNESRSVTYASALTGAGNVDDYRYVPHRADGYYGNYININLGTPGINIYARPANRGELRVTQHETTDDYRDIRARGVYTNRIDSNGHDNQIGGNAHIYLAPRGEVRISTGAEVSNQYGTLRAGVIHAENVAINGQGGAVHLNLKPNGNASDVRVIDYGNGDYRDVRCRKLHESSSREFKTNIRPVNESGLAEAMKLTVVEYNWKGKLIEGIDEKEWGFISEDSPFIATSDMKAIDGYRVRALSVKSIQELYSYRLNDREDIDQLKQKVRELEDEIIQLKAA